MLASWPFGHALLCDSRPGPSSVSTSWPWPEGCPGSHAVGEGKPEATAEHPGFLNSLPALAEPPTRVSGAHAPGGRANLWEPAISPRAIWGRAG